MINDNSCWGNLVLATNPDCEPNRSRFYLEKSHVKRNLKGLSMPLPIVSMSLYENDLLGSVVSGYEHIFVSKSTLNRGK